ncbi:hypothetical protein MMC17_004818 [Xylographa soralifera]|nr:hypothetical protein [Xylographa soralifera]
MVTCASFGFLASASRQTWAFARDRGLPFSTFLAHVDQRSALPLRAVAFCAVFVALIGLINIGSTVAFNAIVSLTIAGLYGSYMIAILLLVLKRISGEPIRWGPWRLGRAGLAINLFSVGFLVVSIAFSFFPPGVPVTPVMMNWSVVVFGGAVVFGLVYYAVRGRRLYQGPVVEVPVVVGRAMRTAVMTEEPA